MRFQTAGFFTYTSVSSTGSEIKSLPQDPGGYNRLYHLQDSLITGLAHEARISSSVPVYFGAPERSGRPLVYCRLDTGGLVYSGGLLLELASTYNQLNLKTQ